MIPCPRCDQPAAGTPGAVPMHRQRDGATVNFHELCHDLTRAELVPGTPAQVASRVEHARREHAERLAACSKGRTRR